VTTLEVSAGPNDWLISPAGNLVLFIGSEMVIAGVTERALIATLTTPALLDFTKANLPHPSQDIAEAIQRLQEMAGADAAFAKEEVTSSFARVHAHHAVATWAAIETAVEQTLVNHIRKMPEAPTLIVKSAPGLKAEQIRTTTEKDAKDTILNWARALAPKPIMSRYVVMLKAFGLALSMSLDEERALSELVEMRNVLLHRGGVADQKFADKCDWTKIKPGQSITIDVADMKRYFDAASTFAGGLIGAVAKSPLIKIVKQSD